MTAHRTHVQRAAVLGVVAPLLTAGLLTTAGPASAIPVEGDPSPSTCLRLERLPRAVAAASTLFVSQGHVYVLGSEC